MTIDTAPLPDLVARSHVTAASLVWAAALEFKPASNVLQRMLDQLFECGATVERLRFQNDSQATNPTCEILFIALEPAARHLTRTWEIDEDVLRVDVCRAQIARLPRNGTTAADSHVKF